MDDAKTSAVQAAVGFTIHEQQLPTAAPATAEQQAWQLSFVLASAEAEEACCRSIGIFLSHGRTRGHELVELATISRN